MEYVVLGRTNLMVSRSALGTRKLSECSDDETNVILESSYNGGINFFETSRAYSNVERKIGMSFYSKRKDIVIFSKSTASNDKALHKDIEDSLDQLTSDYIDIYGIQCVDSLPIPGSDDGLYNELLHNRRKGKINFFALITDNLKIAIEACKSGLYDVIQYPFNLLASDDDLELIKLCEKNDVGFIASKTLASGKIENAPLAFGYLKQYENVISIWGVSSSEDIQKLLYFETNPPTINDQFLQEIEQLKEKIHSIKE